MATNPERRSRFGFLRIPEVQFFLIFTIPFTGFFLVNYLNLSSASQTFALILSISMIVIVLMQTIYSAHAHSVLRQEEDNFLAITAHQMRTPLTAVRWTLQELRQQGVREVDREELIRVGSLAGERLENIISSFAQLARLEDHLEFHFEAVDLIEVVERAVTDAEPVGKQYSVSVYFEKPQYGVEVIADRGKIEAILASMIHNAIEYNRKSGIVTLRVRALTADKLAEVTIEDTGIGMTAVQQARLFQRYSRADDAKKLNPAGTGLGLYLAKRIVDHHKGRIWAESIPGKGSAFHFTLPLVR